MIHEIKNGTCVRCGCTESAINSFGWKCREKESEKDDNENATLMPCADCGKDISKHARSCPHCGRLMGIRIRKRHSITRKQQPQLLGCGGVIAVTVLFIGVFGALSALFSGKEKIVIAPAVRVDGELARSSGLKPGTVMPAITHERDQTGSERVGEFIIGLVLAGGALMVLLDKYKTYKDMTKPKS